MLNFVNFFFTCSAAQLYVTRVITHRMCICVSVCRSLVAQRFLEQSVNRILKKDCCRVLRSNRLSNVLTVNPSSRARCENVENIYADESNKADERSRCSHEESWQAIRDRMLQK